jgi:tRNA(Ser,Leu) C12 N-acetylase TAN1
MESWNVLVTVVPGPDHESRLLHGLRRLGSFRHSHFKDVLIGRHAADVESFLSALQHAHESDTDWVRPLARVIPVEHTFRFEGDTLAEQFAQWAVVVVERIPGGSSFHVRLERRGMEGKVDTPRIEREVADRVFARAEELGKQLRVSFGDPDYIIAAETLGNECGVALLDRALRHRFPFVQAR